jgi:FixJ family two-component response regulator
MCERGGPRIALVDDDPSVAAILRLFRLAGIHAEHFDSAENLLCADVSVACYVIDIDLPGMSGIDLQRRLRSTRSPAPAILITADDDPAIMTAAIAAGAVALLVKPFTGRKLAETVRSFAFQR